MKKFLYILAFVLIYGFINMEMIAQLEASTPYGMITEKLNLDPVSLFANPDQYDSNDPEVICLAENLFHEARGEGVKGKLAVAFVTINRVNHTRWPDTVCDVVHQPYQFSWTHQGMTINLDNPIEQRSWDQSQRVALEVLNGDHINTMIGVTHYHTTAVSPTWNKSKVVTAQVGNHVFYSSE